MNNRDSRTPWGMVSFLLGIVFGGIATLLFSTDEGGKTKKKVQKQIAQIKETVIEVADKERIKEVFGEVSGRTKEMYLTAKENLGNQIEELKSQFETVDKEKYISVVQEVVNGLRKEGKYTASQMKKLKTFFVADYKKLTTTKAKTKGK